MKKPTAALYEPFVATGISFFASLVAYLVTDTLKDAFGLDTITENWIVAVVTIVTGFTLYMAILRRIIRSYSRNLVYSLLALLCGLLLSAWLKQPASQYMIWIMVSHIALPTPVQWLCISVLTNGGNSGGEASASLHTDSEGK